MTGGLTLSDDQKLDRVALRTSLAATVCPPRAPRSAFRSRLVGWDELTRAEREHAAAGFPRLDRYAGRIAAKRSVQRMLGRAGPVAARDVEIVSDRDGRPRVVLHGNAPSIARFAGIDPDDVHLSISHRAERAVAVAAPAPFEVGIDLVDRASVERALATFGARYASHVLAPDEMQTAGATAAASFVVADALAAKEAAGKILKASWPAVSWHDVRVEPAVAAVPEPLCVLARECSLEIGFGRPRYARVTVPSSPADMVWVVFAERPGWLCALAMRGPVTRTERGVA